jgi:predicted CXXCH cytochrome family protein
VELRRAFLTRRAKGGVSTKEETVSADVVRIGRGTENEIYLPDPRVPLRMAALHFNPNNGLFCEALGTTSDLRLNGNVVRNAEVSVGDEIGVGPYQIIVVEPPEDKDAAVTVELTQPMGDDVKALLARSRTTLAAGGMGKRVWAWLFFLVVAIGFIGLPIGGHLFDAGKATSGPAGMKNDLSFDIAWKSGEMMDAHKFFADDCGACHQQAFEMTPNTACAACHVNTQHHADPVAFPDHDLTEARCSSCHKDHQGPNPLFHANQQLCADCHQDLRDDAPNTTLENAADFGTNHPQFRPTVSTDPDKNIWTRISLDDDPKELSNLKFTHKTHLDAKKMRLPTGGTKQLMCASCHTVEPGGALMKKVSMETHCSDCHRLTFDPSAPTRQVSHGKPKVVLRELSEFYAARALEGGVIDETAPAVVRRRPGTSLSEPEREEALDWSRTRTAQAASYIFSASQCGTCHTVVKGENHADWTVRPVRLTDRWQPKSIFSHNKHRDMQCTDCHATSESMSSTDVLLPKIEMCRDCHGGDKSTDKVPSTCIMCHGFHSPDQPPMVKPEEMAEK